MLLVCRLTQCADRQGKGNFLNGVFGKRVTSKCPIQNLFPTANQIGYHRQMVNLSSSTHPAAARSSAAAAPKNSRHWTPDKMVAFIQALGLERPFLFGHSVGTLTALIVVAQAPQQLRALVLQDPPFMTE